MKDFFKTIILITIMMALTAIAIWGAVTVNSDTEFGWKLWGAILFCGIVAVPSSVFWRKQIMYVIDLEDYW